MCERIPILTAEAPTSCQASLRMGVELRAEQQIPPPASALARASWACAAGQQQLIESVEPDASVAACPTRLAHRLPGGDSCTSHDASLSFPGSAAFVTVSSWRPITPGRSRTQAVFHVWQLFGYARAAVDSSSDVVKVCD
jgi:hypothetical protein